MDEISERDESRSCRDGQLGRSRATQESDSFQFSPKIESIYLKTYFTACYHYIYLNSPINTNMVKTIVISDELHTEINSLKAHERQPFHEIVEEGIKLLRASREGKK